MTKKPGKEKIRVIETMNITVLLPTFHRPVRLRRALKSIRKTADVKIVVACDPDDVEAVEIAAEFDADFAICDKPRQGCANAWNTALRASPDDDIYVIAADDAIFCKGWLEAALLALKKLGGSGLIGFRSGRRKDWADHYMMTRDFMIEHHGGVAAIPHYTAWCLDDEAVLRARRAKQFIKAWDAVVIHKQGERHDEGFRLNEERIEANRQIYYRREKAGFPDDFEPILRKTETDRMIDIMRKVE